MELKAYNVVSTADVNPEVVDILGCTEWLGYDKDEADKVIAELENELQAANEQIENLINSASRIMLFQDNVNDNKCAELRHNKYKRCLAMVKYCDMGLTCYNEKLDRFSCERADFFYRWYNRWWKLAEKFKEAK